MRLCYTMCFSSTVICLLVVTCHGSVINSYQSELENKEENDGSRLNDTSQILSRNLLKHNLTSSDIENHLSNLHQNQDLSLHLDTRHIPISTNSPSTFHPRKPRAADDSFELKVSERNDPSDPRRTPSPEPKAEQPNHPSAQNHHSHHHHNKSHPEHHDHEDEYYDELDSHDSFHDHDDHEHSASERQPVTSNHMVHKPDVSSGKQKKHSHNHDCGDEINEHDDHDHNDTSHGEAIKNGSSDDKAISGKVWLYASLAVLAISLCGLFSVAVIPIMQKWFYQTLLQFLVGLAVGSLSGDGLLHLMPHAILSGEFSHDHSNGGGDRYISSASMQSIETKAIWKGLAALCGIFLFFIAERLLGALTTYRRQKKEALSRHSTRRLPNAHEDGTNNGSVGEKLTQPKKNSYDHVSQKDEKETIQMLQSEASPSRKGSNQSVHEIGFHGRSSFSMEPDAAVTYRPDSEASVVVSDHHGHSHGHSHEIPNSVSAVAWMVIMGDGLHNFCDGLALGAAFASSEADGLSTTVAVFCHELPHELGDFAMLLKTGMKVKQALFYNGLSSVLCFIGMVIGVSLGKVPSSTSWIFAGTAGMFLYIALVDMLPELSTPTNSPGSALMTTLVQVLGIVIGIGIMLIIGLYEHELHSIVS